MTYHTLVVDDNRSMAENLAQMIHLLGHSADVAWGSREALKKLNERLPDILFLDISMPGMDGLEMCRYLRKENWAAKLPIVIVSVNDDLAHTDAAFLAGADYYLVKPVQLHELELILQQINRLIKSRSEE